MVVATGYLACRLHRFDSIVSFFPPRHCCVDGLFFFFFFFFFFHGDGCFDACEILCKSIFFFFCFLDRGWFVQDDDCCCIIAIFIVVVVVLIIIVIVIVDLHIAFFANPRFDPFNQFLFLLLCLFFLFLLETGSLFGIFLKEPFLLVLLSPDCRVVVVVGQHCGKSICSNTIVVVFLLLNRSCCSFFQKDNSGFLFLLCHVLIDFGSFFW